MGRIRMASARRTSHSLRRGRRQLAVHSRMLTPVIQAKPGMTPATLSEEQDSEGSAMSISMANAENTMASSMVTT